MNLNKEIITKISKQDAKIGGFIETLFKFNCVGFEHAQDMITAIKVLEEEHIDYSYEKSKFLIWLPNLSEVLQTKFRKL